MKKYYEAYDERYKLIHKKGYSWSSNIPTPIVLDVIERYGINNNSSILELGCGEARDASLLLDKGYDVIASDISPEAIDYCIRNNTKHKDKFIVMDCLNDEHNNTYDFIYGIAIIHMLVEDSDRNRFYKFIYNHLKNSGKALICSMGNGIDEISSDTSEAFELAIRNHESGDILVPSTSLRMVSFKTFEKELADNKFTILEKGISSSLPDFNNLMYVVIQK